ncbi:MAG: hypothetical protein SVV03_03055, partial [Candidatus Nanohaloarchaea archaeon]|nr:hypothetical protein [Candidatus Nanohaloarchaea archaeon]
MVKAIIFDADHTLYTPKTEKAYEAQFKHLADQLGVGRERIKEIWRQQIDRVIGVKDPEERRRETALERTLMELELPVDSKEQLAEDAVQHFWNQVVEDLEYSGKTPQILEKLEERGVELLAVA